jgi:hypothetical protein
MPGEVGHRNRTRNRRKPCFENRSTIIVVAVLNITRSLRLVR